MLLPDTPEEGAQASAQRLRRDVEKTAFPSAEGTFSVTVSIGIAEQVADMRAAADMLRLADAALYKAKLGGRNRVVIGDG